ncbi:MAG: DUF2934 domain-containing protein [Dehalococcoidia bacterium]|nr:DUF2934 domain-containing protein [Dehalococcoidia bacterium]
MADALVTEKGEHVRRIAYELWESSGRPAGCDLEHWLRAEAMWQASQTPAAAPQAASAGKPRSSAPATPPKEAKKRGPYKPF